MDDREALDLAVAFNRQVGNGLYSIIVGLNLVILSESPQAGIVANIQGGTFVNKNILEVAKDEWREILVAKIVAKCITNKSNAKWLSLRFSRQYEYWLIVLNYQPLINYSTGNVIGVKISAEVPQYPLHFYAIDEIITRVYKSIPVKVKLDKRLTNREVEVLFLLFHCDSYEKIASLLTLTIGQKFSKNMVAKVVSRGLYPKFNVLNLEALKVTTSAKGFHRRVPVTLFGEFMYPLKKL